MGIYLNHLGYVPGAAKFVLGGGPTEGEFTIRDEGSQQTVYRGSLGKVDSDFGLYTRGDFSALRTPGVYTLGVGLERSRPFRIAEDIYQPMLQGMLGYLRLQRCGNTAAGWNGACHLDDGLRLDNDVYQDVEGGWHDACDLRKWVSATILGMLGLARLKQVLAPAWDAGEILAELRWGNRYFLKMQEPAGYVMNHIGGDCLAFADGNRWTDHRLTGDARRIDTHPCDLTSQWVFVQAQAAMTGLLRESDPAGAQVCWQAALRARAWLLAEDRTREAGPLGAAVSALAQMYRLSGDAACLEEAAGFAGRLLALQVTRRQDSNSPVWGFFWSGPQGRDNPMALEPYRSLWQGCWPLAGLCDLLETAGGHPDSGRWRESVRLFCESYLEPMTRRNAFGIVPYGLYRRDPGGGRRLGHFYYRWFYEENPDWYTGINANLAACGAGLATAARLLGRPDWTALAQRQLDWILGCNPFNASTVMGFGDNHPQHMFYGEFDPPTPFLPGAVMNGLSGDRADQPQLRPGSWQECEYWTPMLAYTLWLAAELSQPPSP